MGKTRLFVSLVAVLLMYSCMAWLVTSSSSSSSSSSLSSSSSNFTDQSALLAFKASITFDPGNILTDNWTTSSSFCSWMGVSCSSRSQKVTALNLSYMGIQGTIHPQISNLSFLMVLDLRNNSFHGFLPDELGYLRRLRILILQVNQLEGKIPPSLSQCRELEVISMSFNNFSENIPKELGMLPMLNFLYLFGNDLTSAIPSSLGNLSRLQSLFLESNNLQGSVPEELGSLPNLQLLSLRENQLTGPIPSTLFNISSLQALDLSRNSISGSLPVDIGYRLPNIEQVFFGYNQLSGRIPTSLCQCGALRQLRLDSNNLTGSLPREIGCFPNLDYLTIRQNSLTGTIPASLGNISKLEVIDLGFNHFVGEIPQEVGYLQHLQIIQIASNGLTGSIPEMIFNISTLQHMDLGINRLSGHVPTSAGTWLPNLEGLFLDDNRLSGNFPISITNATRLTILEFSSNSFNGSIPTSLGHLRFLKILNLAVNQLSNQPDTRELSFLSSLTNCKVLEYVSIDINPLNGILPNSIWNLSTSLHTFTAYGCQIKGSIPREIGNLSKLITLHFGSNDISGTIPSTIGRLEKLQRFFIQRNILIGSIPKDLCFLTRLGALSLRDNKLSGQIPSCIANLSQLNLLFLASNMLTSPIPLSLWNLKDLSNLNLSHNCLYEYLPPELGNLDVLQTLDLSWNRFSGQISSTIGNLQRLTQLMLSQNSLQGPLPQALGNLISLEFLDLSQNNISGEIPKSLENLLYLNYLNLSFNRLWGEIPKGGSFANFTRESFMGNDALCGASSKQGVPPCARTAPKSRTKFFKLKYILPAIVSIVIFVAIIVVLLSLLKKKQTPFPIDLSPTTQHRMISYQELRHATNNFNEVSLLGVGGFSSVFKGQLSDGTIVAIKVFDLQLDGAFKSFEAECQVMRSVRHRNLVKIISSCSNLDFRAVVMQFLPKGSLEKWLYSHNYFLDILQRINIMIDVALALEYLHHNYSEPIVHCDMKPSNVLLDEDMVAHVADFGIAKILAANNSTMQTMTLGTIGYIAPEYGLGGRVSTSCDVYSYGIMLMETFTRKRPTDKMFSEDLSLRQWVNAELPKTVMAVVDTNLFLRGDEVDSAARQQCLLSILGLALDCSRESPEERTDMKDVVMRLKKIKGEFVVNSRGSSSSTNP